MRGGTVDVDTRRATQVLTTVLLIVLGVAVVVLFAADVTKNADINELHNHGVRVEVTVRTCEGQLGGSGSNAAAYRCTGLFVLGGRHVTVTLPGSSFHPLGTKVLLVTTTNDPGLVATVSQSRDDRASLGVFALPSLVLIAFLALVARVILRRRRTRSRPPTDDAG